MALVRSAGFERRSSTAAGSEASQPLRRAKVVNDRRVATWRTAVVRSAVAFAQEDDLWMVTLAGYLGEQPPTDPAGFLRFAASLPTPEVGELLSAAEPVGEPATAHFPASRRRMFERMRTFPGRPPRGRAGTSKRHSSTFRVVIRCKRS
jgi:hypothetical protein